MTYDDPLITYDGQLTDASFNTMLSKVNEVWGRLGLDASAPLVTEQTSISFGSVSMDVVESGDTVTVTRT
jgi:hypothetical protein